VKFLQANICVTQLLFRMPWNKQRFYRQSFQTFLYSLPVRRSK